MLTDLFFYSGILGLVGLLPLTEKYKRTSSLFFVAALLGVAVLFFMGYQEHNTDSFSFFWMRTQKYRIEININSSLKNYIRLFPVIIMTLLTAFYRAANCRKQKDENFYALISFNIANMIILVSSQNLVQLLTCIYVADIISQAMIKQFGISKKYIFYSLFADLGLFMIFAMIQGKLKSFNLDGFVAYKKIGKHKDFVAIATLLFIFAKMGFFMFQSFLLDLKNIKTDKLISIVSFGGVLSGFFILIKMYPLLQISDYSLPIIIYAIASSAVWGFVCAMIMGGIKRQIVYYNMLLHSFVVYIFVVKGDFDEETAVYLLLGYITSYVLTVSAKYVKSLLRFFVFIAWTATFYIYHEQADLVHYAFWTALLSSVIFVGNIKCFYQFEFLQKADIFSRLYGIIFIKPVMILGRGLWLLIDFMIMEKHVVSKVEAAGNISAEYIEKIKNCSLSARILWLIYVFAMFAVSLYFGGIR